jgi:hypothetical protein
VAFEVWPGVFPVAPVLFFATGVIPMLKLSNLYFGVLALLGLSIPLAALTGYDSPACGWSSVWSFTGIHYQYVCF